MIHSLYCSGRERTFAGPIHTIGRVRRRWLRSVLPVFWAWVSVETGFGQSSYQTDTAYVSSLLKKGEAVQTQQPQVAIRFYQQAYRMAGRIHFAKGYFESVRVLTYQLNNVGNHREARNIAQKALTLAQQDTSKRNRAICHFGLANTALQEGNSPEAIAHYQQAARYMRRLGQQKNVAVINQNIGIIYERQKMFSQALASYQRALAYDSTDKQDLRPVAIDYYSIGNIYVRQEKPAVALRYYGRAKQLVDPAKDPDFMISLYNNIGHIHETQARYDSALYYEREALRLSRQLGNSSQELSLLTTLAQTYNQMKQSRQARPLLDAAYGLAAKSHAGLYDRRNIYRNYVVLNENLRNYKAAYTWREKYETINDSLENQDVKALLHDYELKLKQAEADQKLAKKQAQIEQLQQERKRQNLWLLVAALVVAGIGGGLVFGYLYYRQRQQTAANALLAARRERELAVVQSELQGQQKERLRISKEMHDDLGASLTAIGLLSEVMKSRMGTQTTPEVEKISTISAEMVTSMNEIIWSLNTHNDSLNGLIAYTRSYASEFIDNTSLTLRTQVEESPREIGIRGVDRRNVFLTVKEALNNVVKHAQATEVTLIIQPEPGQLRIDVLDNGLGFAPNAPVPLRNGLTNMSNRMVESGGTCTISSSPAGTRVTITYPCAPVPTGKIMQM